MKKVKRGLRQIHHGDVDAKERMKHHNLLQEYLQLQKEFVSKKRKLQTVQEKRETLLAEVRFLRARHVYLLKIHHDKLDIDQNHVQTQNLSKRSKMLVKNRSYGVNEAVLIRSLPLDIMPNMGNENNSNGERRLGVEQEPGRKKKLEICMINDKRVGKKKISWQDPWQDPLTLQVQKFPGK